MFTNATTERNNQPTQPKGVHQENYLLSPSVYFGFYSVCVQLTSAVWLESDGTVTLRPNGAVRHVAGPWTAEVLRDVLCLIELVIEDVLHLNTASSLWLLVGLFLRHRQALVSSSFSLVHTILRRDGEQVGGWTVLSNRPSEGHILHILHVVLGLYEPNHVPQLCLLSL